jgi:hypothetical protein
MSLDWGIALRDGAGLALAASALIMGTLRLNPRLLLRNYPPELRQAVPPQTPRERGLATLIGLVLIGMLAAWPAVSVMAAHRSGLPAGFGPAFGHAFVVGTVFNLVDWLLLDELWLGLLRPRWAMLPGAEDVAFRFNHLQHLRGFVVGSVVTALFASGIGLALGG